MPNIHVPAMSWLRNIKTDKKKQKYYLSKKSEALWQGLLFRLCFCKVCSMHIFKEL